MFLKQQSASVSAISLVFFLPTLMLGLCLPTNFLSLLLFHYHPLGLIFFIFSQFLLFVLGCFSFLVTEHVQWLPLK